MSIYQFGDNQPVAGVSLGATKKSTTKFVRLLTDDNGYLYVNVTNGGTGGTSSVDETPFIAGTSVGTPIMAEDPTSGELLIAQMSFAIKPPASGTCVPSLTLLGTGKC